MNLSLSSYQIFPTLLGCIAGVLLFPITRFLFNLMTIQVEDETVVMINRFGRLEKVLKDPGLHFFPRKAFPWVKITHVSLHRDFREYENVHVNDCRGTTVIVNFWIEFRIVNPERALFHIEDWEHSLQSVVTHSGTSILCTHEFNKILSNRHELGVSLKNDIQAEISRWGVEVEVVMIKKVSLLPEVSRQRFTAVAAKLDRVKANFEEEGRLRVARLEAEVSVQVAALVAQAKGQYPEAVGRAYYTLNANPQVLKAYQELYDLSMVRPKTTVSFQGFSKNDIREMDAAMVATPHDESSLTSLDHSRSVKEDRSGDS